MKVLLYIDNLGAGGAQRQLAGLASLLSNDGYEVMVLTYHDWAFYNSLLSDNIQYLCLEDNGNAIKRLRNFIKILKEFKPKTVISYLRSPNIFACSTKMLGFYKGRLIVSERSLTQKCDRSDKAKYFFYRYADKIVANSYAQLEYIRDNYPAVYEKSMAIPNFVDLIKFSPGRKEYSQRTNTIIVVASIYEVKNPKRLIQAASALKQQGFQFVIKWFGVDSREDPYYQNCWRLVCDERIKDVFLFLDKTKDIASEYRKSDFFCLPSLFEGTSNALCEAMASGLPVACGNISDNARYVKDGETGFLFDPEDVGSMINALSKILNLTQEEYEAYSTNCRKIAENNWSDKLFLNRYKKVIEFVL